MLVYKYASLPMCGQIQIGIEKDCWLTLRNSQQKWLECNLYVFPLPFPISLAIEVRLVVTFNDCFVKNQTETFVSAAQVKNLKITEIKFML